MDGQLQTFDFIVLIVYMLGVFGLGCWFARKSGTTNEFMAAGRSLPGWAVGLSVFGTYVSSIGFLGNTGKAFSGNWNSWVFGLSLPIAAIFAVRYFVPLYRGEQNISAYYQLEKRFGPWARLYAMGSYLLSQLARIGTILYLVALALAPLTGWDIRTIIVITGILVTIYTLIGGIEAVIWTDVVQSFVLVGGAFLCAAILIWGDGGSQLMEVAKQNNKFSLGSFSLAPDTLVAPDPTFWMVLVYGIFINLTNFGIDQSFVQRYLTAKSDKDAKFSVWLACLLFPVISALFFFIGTGLHSYAETHPDFLQQVQASVSEQLPDDISATDRAEAMSVGSIGDKVLPQFIISKLPAGLAGLLIAAIFAAAMSSMDTSLNSSATLVLCDVYKRFLRPNAEERESMRVLYGSTFVFGLAGTLTALAMIQVRSALDAWWNLQGIFTGGMLGLFLLGLISKRAKNPHAAVAVAVGLAVILWVSLSPTRVLNQPIPFSTAAVQDTGANVADPSVLFATDLQADTKFDSMELRNIPSGVKIVDADGGELPIEDGVLQLSMSQASGLSLKPKSLGSNLNILLSLKTADAMDNIQQTIVVQTPSVLHKYMTNVVGTSTIVLLGVLLASLFGKRP